MEQLYFCPISARFSTSSFELLTPNDTPIERFEQPDADLRAILASEQLKVQEEHPEASDACMAAYALDGERYALISRHPYAADDLERITDELFLAAGFPELSGIQQSLVTKEGHIVLVTDYAPIAQEISTAEHAANVISDLRALQDAGLVHGGINERFLHPEHPAGRRIFGLGLSELYAAWRRNQGLQLGDLRADPRFASPEDLRGEPATSQSDGFALAATLLSETAEDSSTTPALDPVQGVNALLQKAGQKERLIEEANAIGDRRVKDDLLAMMTPPKTPDLRIWRITVLIICGLSALMLLWLVIPSSPHHNEGTTESAALQSVPCRGASVAIVDGQCAPGDAYARCGEGTVMDSDAGLCVPIAEEEAPEDAADETAEAPEEEDIDTIHPVLECADDERSLSQSFSFGNDDLNLTQGERTRLSRFSAQCSGEASVVYYVSNPDLEARTHTIYKEFRSSTTCGSKCREALPEEPTSVVYVPYVGTIDRAADHYLFFECCQ